MLAAALKGLPTLAFEPNVVPGFANRIVAPMATMAAVHFEKTQHYFRRSVVTGVPVRRPFFDIPPRPVGSRPTVLLFGGSQGAHALNVALTEALPSINARVAGIHIVHQTGERDYDATAAAYLRSGVSGEVSPFIDDMPSAFANTDLLICRSGASTVAEVAASGKPAIFIPFPGATDDHQLRNAEALAEAGAAVLLPEKELTPGRLTDLVAELLGDRDRLARMSVKARALSHSNAAREIAELVARIAGIPTG
jgi:UDP-N-acetylglucosamine--N-acetylmuramyl-(pentapeptide) pyrophosphoryl-undecaprenol N-acetylglucosamine transferase